MKPCIGAKFFRIRFHGFDNSGNAEFVISFRTVQRSKKTQKWYLFFNELIYHYNKTIKETF